MKTYICIFGIFLLISVISGAHLRNGCINENIKQFQQMNEINNIQNDITVEIQQNDQNDEINHEQILAHQEDNQKEGEIMGKIYDAETKSEVSLKDTVSEIIKNEMSTLDDPVSLIQLEGQSPSSFVTLFISAPKMKNKKDQINNALVALQTEDFTNFEQLRQQTTEPLNQQSEIIQDDSQLQMPEDVLIDGTLQSTQNSQQINIGLSMQESPLITDEEYHKLESEYQDSANSIIEDKSQPEIYLQPEEIEYEKLKKQQQQEQQLDASGQQMLQAETNEAKQVQEEYIEPIQNDAEIQSQGVESSPLLKFGDDYIPAVETSFSEINSNDLIVW